MERGEHKTEVETFLNMGPCLAALPTFLDVQMLLGCGQG